jgi:AraC-like DNA-binding protein
MRSSHLVDVLTDLLQRSRARGAAFSHSTMHGDWGVAFGAIPGLAVHAIVDGEIYLWSRDEHESTRLLPGDIVLVRGDVEHQMAHVPGAACTPMQELITHDSERSPARRLARANGTAGRAAVFFCGAYMFEGDLCAGLLASLPDLVHVRPGPGNPLRATMDLLAGEMLNDAAGQQALLDRLLDVALVQLLREHFTAHEDAAPAWFRAMNDPAVGPALRALHADPARRWTVADLAAEAALSRATFARRFTDVLGAGPLAYLTDWRMALAREQLRDSDAPLAAIADALGYSSEFSFAAAFKRHEGVAPGRWRARARTAA